MKFTSTVKCYSTLRSKIKSHADLEVCRFEGVVDGNDYVFSSLMGDVSHGLYVDQLEGRIRRSLDPNHSGVRTNGSNNLNCCG